MRLAPLLAVLLLYCGACPAQTVVPLDLEGGDYLLTLRIGSSRLKAVLDTSGHYGIAITPEALAKLQVRFSGDTITRTGMGGESFRGRDFVIPSVEIGGTIFLNVDGFERRHEEIGAFGSGTYDAVIGGAFLEHHTAVIDYPGRRFELYPSGHTPASCEATAPMLPTQNNIEFTTVKTDNGVMNLGWSSGSTYSVVQKTVVGLRGLKLKDGFYSTRRFSLEHFDAGPVDMVEIDVPGIPDLDGLIGFDFFERYRVCFDYARHTVSVRAPVETKERHIPARQ